MPTRAFSPVSSCSLNGEQPLLLGSNVRDDNTLLAVDLTNPDFYDGEHITLQKDIVHIARTIFLWRGTAYQRLALRNHGDRPIVLDLSLHFDNDFADLFEVRGIAARAPRHRAPQGRRARSGSAELSGPRRRVAAHPLIFDPAPTKLAATTASYRIDLAPHEAKPIFLVVACNEPGVQRPVPFLRGLLAAHRELRAATRGMATVETSNELFNEVLCRSAADLVHADDRHAAGPLSLCRHSLVLDDVRARRADHGDADAVVRSRAWRAASCAGSRRSRPRPAIRYRTRSRARSCTRCAPAKWRRWARCRSASTTAASIRRRCSCCSPGSMSSAPATRRR